MLIRPPKELDNKLAFLDNNVYIKEGITLSEKEQELFEHYRNKVAEAYEKWPDC